MNSPALARRLRKFTVFSVLANFVLYYEIDKLFMQARGLSVTQIVTVEIVYASLVLLLEVPLGALSDRWSRKYVLALNVAFFMLNTLLWVLAHGPNLFLLGAMAGSVHSALRSGTDTSFLYDTLKEADVEASFERTWGRILVYTNAFGILAAVSGAMLVSAFGLSTPFWLTLLVSGAALLAALTLEEPSFSRTTQASNYWKHVVATARYMFGRTSLLKLALLWVMLQATFVLADEYGQLYYAAIGLPIFFFGLLGTVGNVLEGLGGWLAERLARLNHEALYAALVLFSATGFALSAVLHSGLGIVFLFFPAAAFYLAIPVMLGDLHRRLPSAQRATGESLVSLLSRLAFLPLGFVFGRLADRASIFWAFASLAILLSVYWLVTVVFSRR